MKYCSTGCPKKNDTKNLVSFQKPSDTKWHEIIKTKCLTIWGVDFNKLKATWMPLKKTRAKRAVKNLTARLALVFLPSIIEQSTFWQCDRYWSYASTATSETMIYCFEQKLEPNGQWTARLALVFPQNIHLQILYVFPIAWVRVHFLTYDMFSILLFWGF